MNGQAGLMTSQHMLNGQVETSDGNKSAEVRGPYPTQQKRSDESRH